MNFYKIILVVLALFFVNQNIEAQEEDYLYGKIVNSDTDAIYDAKIYWNTKDKDGKTTSKSDGTFRIVKKRGEKNTLVIEKPGKKSRELSVSDSVNEFVYVVMKDKGVTSITASRWEQSIYEVPASTIIISREEIEQNGYLTLQEILENVPGLFTIDQRYASGVTIGIRGFWTDFSRNVMIQLNGINMLNDRRNDFPLDKINVAVESIDKIEIVRGPMSVIYGDGAFFGVINIITNSSQEASSSSFTSGYGTQNTIKQTLRYALNKDGLNLSFNAMMFHRDGFSEEWKDLISSDLAKSDSTKHNSAFKFPNAVTLADYYYDEENPNINPERYSRKYKSFNMSMSYDGFFSNINFSNSNSGFSYKAVGPGDRNDYKTRNSHYQFGYRNEIKNLGNGLEWQLKTEYMTSRGNQISSRYVDTMLIIGEDRISSIRTELNTRYPIIKKKLDLISGLYYNYNYENGTFYNAPDLNLRNWYVGLDPDEDRLTTIAGYAQLQSKINNWQIIGGLRISQQGSYKMLNEENVGYYGDSLFGFDLGWENDSNQIKFQRQNETKPASDIQLIPRFAAIYHDSISKNLNQYFKLMYGKAVNEINVVQNAYDIMKKNANLSKADSVYTDNQRYEYLSPEKIHTIELGYTLVKEGKDDVTYELNTNIFFNVLTDLITRQTSQKHGVYVTNSVNDKNQILTRGIEFLGKTEYKISKKYKIALQGGLTLQSTKSANGSISFKDVFSEINYINQTEFYDAMKDNKTSDSSTYYNDQYPTSFSPPVLANFNIISYFELKKKAHLTLNLGGNYVGPMWGQAKETFIDLDNGDKQEIPSYYGDSSSVEIPGYWRFSINVRLSHLKIKKKLDKNGNVIHHEGSLYMNLKFSNIFDTRYKYPNHSYTSYFDKGVFGRRRQIIGNIGYKF